MSGSANAESLVCSPLFDISKLQYHLMLCGIAFGARLGWANGWASATWFGRRSSKNAHSFVRAQWPQTRGDLLPLTASESLITLSRSFTYVNDNPQEVRVGETWELVSSDLLNHFITGTRFEWPFLAGG